MTYEEKLALLDQADAATMEDETILKMIQDTCDAVLPKALLSEYEQRVFVMMLMALAVGGAASVLAKQLGLTLRDVQLTPQESEDNHAKLMELAIFGRPLSEDGLD